jgi:hypothetical protein
LTQNNMNTPKIDRIERTKRRSVCSSSMVAIISKSIKGTVR